MNMVLEIPQKSPERFENKTKRAKRVRYPRHPRIAVGVSFDYRRAAAVAILKIAEPLGPRAAAHRDLHHQHRPALIPVRSPQARQTATPSQCPCASSTALVTGKHSAHHQAL